MGRIKDAFKVFLMLGICTVSITLMYLHESNARQTNDTTQPIINNIPDFYNRSPQDGLWDALIYYDVKHPDIVYAQAILETGYFKSQGCTRDHNLFGLYNSKRGQYYKFNHWTESIEAYKEWVQYRYKPPNDYYEFLRKIRYAEDTTYTVKLKQIVKRHGKTKQSTSSSYNQ